MSWIALTALALILARLATELWLARLNERHIASRRARLPDELVEVLDPVTWGKAVEYTLARSRHGQVHAVCRSGVLTATLFSGILPAWWGAWSAALGRSAWADAGFLVAVAGLLQVTDLPFDWHAQFRLEERFGFNTRNLRTWILDQLKALGLAALLGEALLALILKLAGWMGPGWWLWAWLATLGFQLAMTVLAPVIILPWFNQFAPLPEGTLRERLSGLARRAGFPVRDLFVMDGSRRSRHSNAFFTGLGRFRRVVLFDTLIEQLTEPELEAVLAHEIGHFRRRHILRMLLASAIGSLAGFGAVGWLAGQPPFAASFGFPEGGLVPTLLLAGGLAGTVSFWLAPAANLWLRRYEYQADQFAAEMIGEPGPLIAALRTLGRKNLSNPMPHPLFSGFYYSHPTLLERERALRSTARRASPRVGPDRLSGF